MPRILFIVNHRKDRSPGQRYRFEQYVPYLEKAGYECVFSPMIITKDEDDIFYSPGNYFAKLLLFLKAAIRRFKDVLRAKDFDIIFVFREAFMTGTTIFERLYKRSGAKIIFDFDDAIWHHDISEANKALGWLKRPEKTGDIIGFSDLIIGGNKYLAEYAMKFNPNTVVVPSTVDFDYYKLPTPIDKTSNEVVIGWSGSLTTVAHFKLIVPVLKKIKDRYGKRVSFKVFGLPNYYSPELETTGIGWTPENEVPVIASFDIGIMPLPDTEWAKGKCGMKGLQYMALEVPTIMSSVGVNTEIIQDGINGYLAKDPEEWIAKLGTLIDSKEKRKEMGVAGRKTVIEKYSVSSQKDRYVTLFNNLLKRK